MSLSGETAYVVGGASGIGRALATMLASKGAKIVIADCNFEGAREVALEIQQSSSQDAVSAVHVDLADWDSQVRAFETTVRILGRVDYVCIVGGIFEQPWLPNRPKAAGFEKPDMATFDVNAFGPLYATSLAIQQFYRQGLGKHGFRGKVMVVSSGAGFHYIPAMPIYTASKHAIVGLVRSLGMALPDHKITLNAICPGIVRTGISGGDFHDKAEKNGLLVPMETIMDSFESIMGANTTSGAAIEVLPGDAGFLVKERPAYTNDKCRESVQLTHERTQGII